MMDSEKGINRALEEKDEQLVPEVLTIEETDKGSADFVVDIENKRALKGDDSDGAVEWNLKTIIAALCLGALYTGEWTFSKRNCDRNSILTPSQARKLSSTFWEDLLAS